MYVKYKQNLIVEGTYLGYGFPTKTLEEKDIRKNGVSHIEHGLWEKCFDINIVLLTLAEDGKTARLVLQTRYSKEQGGLFRSLRKSFVLYCRYR